MKKKMHLKNGVRVATVISEIFFPRTPASEEAKTCYDKKRDARPRATLATHLAHTDKSTTNVGEKRHKLKENSINRRQ